MPRVAEINTQAPKLDVELASALLTENAKSLAKKEADFSVYSFKASVLKGVHVSRDKRSPNQARTDNIL